MSINSHQPLHCAWEKIQKFTNYTWDVAIKPASDVIYPIFIDASKEISETFSFYGKNPTNPPSLISSSYFLAKAVVCLKAGYFLKITSIFLSVFGLNEDSKSLKRTAHLGFYIAQQSLQASKACFPIQLKTNLDMNQNSLVAATRKFTVSSIQSAQAFYDSSLKKPLNTLMFNLTENPHFKANF